ncbi:MAG: heavy metal translocating P-type ATPase [Lachnospiraceae bacterium]
MKQYTVTGMSCAACSARVEKAVKKVEGVTSCSVSLLTNSMGVEGSASSEAVISAVEAAGYGASFKTGADNVKNAMSEKASYENNEIFSNKASVALRNRLIVSLIFLIVLMYFSMGHMMWGFPAPKALENNHVAMGLLQMLLTIGVMVINQRFFISGFKGLYHRAPNMDTLVALGSAAAFVYSAYALFAMTDAQLRGDMDGVMSYMHEFYFESAAMILTLITVGKLLESISKGRTTDALKGLMRLAPKTALIETDGMEAEVSIDKINVGDIFIVKAGASIPVDGVVIEGGGTVDEASLTGESIPVDKENGDRVSAATISKSGYMKCKALRVGEDTTISQIIKMVSDAAATKAPIAKVADKVSGIFVPIVLLIALATFIIWMFVGKTVGFSLARAISVLVISCPCALGLATPVAIMVGNGAGAKKGIMFKTAASLEETGRVQIVALDKTGTITKGEPRVTDIIPSEGTDENELITLAYILEKKSEHPLARAIMAYGDERLKASKLIENKNDDMLTDFTTLSGNGLSALYNGQRLMGGSLKFISEQLILPDKNVKAEAERLSGEGKTPLLFALGSRLLGIVAVADVIKEDSHEAVRQLKNMGIQVVMITGDNEKTAKAIGSQAGVDNVIAGVLPDGKEEAIRLLQKNGKVAMVGDGINDAPALTRADIGIAIGAGTDIAIDAADIVLVKSRLMDVPAAIRLSRKTLKNIHENLFWAFIYNIIGIPLAAGLWIPVFGWELNPMFGAAAMSLSSFCVVTNALRLNLFNINDASKDKRIKNAIKNLNNINNKEEKMEEKIMTKTMKIEGMMCGHCEAAVKKALEELDGVREAVVSHEAGTAAVELDGQVEDAVLKKAVEDKDYTVTSIE